VQALQSRSLRILRRAGAVALVAWCTGHVPAATAARLHIDGPAGARVRVDGRDVGRLPLAEAIVIDVGSHAVRLDLAGHHPETRHARVQAGSERLDLHFTLDPIRRGHAAAYNLLLAGLGQRRVGRPKLGWLMTGAELGGIAAAITGEVRFRDERDTWYAARDRYTAAVDPAVIAAARRDVDAAYADMGDAETLRNVGIGVAAGAVAWSLLDVTLRAPSTDAIAMRPWFGEHASVGWAVRARF